MCTDSEGHPVACCIHGMATFPQWHRLYVAHFEQALVRHGLTDIGVPYWDWTQPLHELPSLVRVSGAVFRLYLGNGVFNQQRVATHGPSRCSSFRLLYG